MLYNFSEMKSPGGKRDSVRILVIDDEQVIRELLYDALSRKGHLVDTAEDGPGGLAKARSTPYDVIFTDIRMPGMDGLDVYRHLKLISPESRVIVMTGYGLEEIIQEALDLGAFADVKKPFDIDVIYGLVDDALESM
ncbi:MAG: response regulator [Candidatus Hydrogenedentota bacterium]|nr:MAG: response regulator [Candidatus Hydrogenedentota bacterium]